MFVHLSCGEWRKAVSRATGTAAYRNADPDRRHDDDNDACSQSHAWACPPISSGFCGRSTRVAGLEGLRRRGTAPVALFDGVLRLRGDVAGIAHARLGSG